MKMEILTFIRFTGDFSGPRGKIFLNNLKFFDNNFPINFIVNIKIKENLLIFSRKLKMKLKIIKIKFMIKKIYIVILISFILEMTYLI